MRGDCTEDDDAEEHSLHGCSMAWFPRLTRPSNAEIPAAGLLWDVDALELLRISTHQPARPTTQLQRLYCGGQRSPPRNLVPPRRLVGEAPSAAQTRHTSPQCTQWLLVRGLVL